MPLVAVLGATAIVAIFGPQSSGVEVIGAAPSALPQVVMPSIDLADIRTLVLPAVGIVIDDYAGAHQLPGLVVFRYYSPLFFANVEVDITGLDAVDAYTEWVARHPYEGPGAPNGPEPST